MDPAVVLGPSRLALDAYERVSAMLAGFGTVDVRTTRSQVAFRRARAFAWLWPPRTWVRDRADVVLSVALRREAASPRWKQIAHPTPTLWMHHLEIHSLDDLDDEVLGWLREAFDAAGGGT